LLTGLLLLAGLRPLLLLLLLLLALSALLALLHVGVWRGRPLLSLLVARLLLALLQILATLAGLCLLAGGRLLLLIHGPTP